MGWVAKANLRGPAGYNATGAAEDDAAIAAFIAAESGATDTRDALYQAMLDGTTVGDIPVVKPDGDGRAGVWEYTHNDATGYLFHLLAGADMGHSAALIAMGVDNDGIGLLIPNKLAGRAIVGDQRATVTATDGYWMQVTQRSASAPAVRLEMQADDAAHLFQLLAFGSPGTDQRLLYAGDPTGEAGTIFASDGRLRWRRDIQVQDKDGSTVTKINLMSNNGVADNSKQHVHINKNGVEFYNFSGSSGAWWPFALRGSGSSLFIEAGGSTATVGTATRNPVITVKNDQVSFFGATAVKKTGWSTATGTATRSSFATGSVTLPQLAERVKALIDDLHATAGYGLLNS